MFLCVQKVLLKFAVLSGHSVAVSDAWLGQNQFTYFSLHLKYILKMSYFLDYFICVNWAKTRPKLAGFTVFYLSVISRLTALVLERYRKVTALLTLHLFSFFVRKLFKMLTMQEQPKSPFFWIHGHASMEGARYTTTVSPSSRVPLCTRKTTPFLRSATGQT